MIVRHALFAVLTTSAVPTRKYLIVQPYCATILCSLSTVIVVTTCHMASTSSADADDVITPEDVFDIMEEDVQQADLILWVGISFEQSASTAYFRRVSLSLNK